MIHLKRILLCLAISAVISAVFTQLSMTTSTQEAAVQVQDIDFSEEEIAEFSQWAEVSEEEIRQQLQAIESSSTEPSNYPGYWLFWFDAFKILFAACFIALMIQIYLLNSAFNKYFK